MRLGFCLLGMALFATACDDSSGVVAPSPNTDAAVDVGELDSTLDVTVALLDIEPELPEAPICEAGEGCVGEPCEGPDDCLSGYCVPHLGNKVCTETCEGECPAGWECKQVTSAAGDVTFLCISRFTNLCQPCSGSEDCSSELGPGACALYQGEGSFCAAACDAENPCPEGFECKDVETTSGGSSSQCVSTTGMCDCSQTATELGAATPCSVTNDFGTCEGYRSCGDAGLGECDASVPAMETCNGVDDNCDGTVDESACDDGNECTEDWCDAAEGCKHTPFGAIPCDDGDACSFTDTCVEGMCAGEPLVCEDGNPCTNDSCDALFGCDFAANSLSCDDGDDCTFGDYCGDSKCISGPPLACDDGNACTDDVCDGALGCKFTHANANACDDGNACTEDDYCKEGSCAPSSMKACDDGNACTADTCDPSAGCSFVDMPLACDDSNPCTTSDFCQAGACAGQGELTCDDGNGCTDDSCDAVLGCIAVPNAESCDDGNACTTVDGCTNGQCVGDIALVCDDENHCTKDSCAPGTGCVTEANNAPCNDQNGCTVADGCNGGECTPGAALVCDDSNPCTDDTCDPVSGCTYVPNTAPCDDANTCTEGDTCSGGQCVGTGDKTCDDANPCTVDTCLLDGGCTFSPSPLPCDDGNSCTLADGCVEGECQSGVGMTCDDGNPCTDDACADGACVFTANEGPCDDGNACTPNEACDSASCVATETVDCADGNPCTTDSCSPQTGCQAVNNSLPCSDEDSCTTGDVCDEGGCVGQGLWVCDDGNACTDDGCDSDLGCVFSPNNESCDDGNACTSDDACGEGACQGGFSISCDDGNSCTTDWCDLEQGCKTEANSVPCNDGDLCTVGDLCASGACGSGEEVLECADGNDCTDDGCDPATGCTFAPNNNPCSDGSECTQSDACSVGSCTGNIISCDDGESCTADSCDPNSGCTNDLIPNCCGNGITEGGEECDDGNSENDDACSNNCVNQGFPHYNGMGVNWNNGVPTGTHNESQAKLSCEQSHGAGACGQQGGDCAGPGWCFNSKCWGWTSGCSGGPGRVWQYGSSYTTHGNWN
jgi:cysteine-rich repeat protein